MSVHRCPPYPTGLQPARHAGRRAPLPRARASCRQGSGAHANQTSSRCGAAGGGRVQLALQSSPLLHTACAVINSNWDTTFSSCLKALPAASGKFWKEVEACSSSGALSHWAASPGPGLAHPPFSAPLPRLVRARQLQQPLTDQAFRTYLGSILSPFPKHVPSSDTWRAGGQAMLSGIFLVSVVNSFAFGLFFSISSRG